MHFSLQSPVYGNDGLVGYVSGLVMASSPRQIEGIIVQRDGVTKLEFLVPRHNILKSSLRSIEIAGGESQFTDDKRFYVNEFVSLDMPSYGQQRGLLVWGNPHHTPLTCQYMQVTHERLPIKPLAASFGYIILAEDGAVGTVYEYLVDRFSGEVKYLVLYSNYNYANQLFLVPAADVIQVDVRVVRLSLSKCQVERLPTKLMPNPEQFYESAP